MIVKYNSSIFPQNLNLMKITALILLFALSFCTSCNKDDDTPPITAENTFSCKINGERFVPEDFGSFPNSFDGIMSFIPRDSNDWYFQFGNGEKNIFIYLVDVEATGNYILKASDGDSDFFGETENVMEFSNIGNFTSTHKSTNNSGSLKVRSLNINKKIILEFDVITLIGNEDPNNTVTLTDGKLNINLETLNQ